MQSQTTYVFDLVVVKALQPLFTALITAVVTYIFASEGSKVLREYLVARKYTENSQRNSVE